MAGAMLEIAQNYADSSPTCLRPVLVRRRSMSQKARRVSLYRKRLIRTSQLNPKTAQSLTHRRLGNTTGDRPD